MPNSDPRPTTTAPDDDPYLWLEDIEGETPLAWAHDQNARTLAVFGGQQFSADRDMLTAIFDRQDNIPYIIRRNGKLQNFWRDEQNPRGLWRRTTMDDYRKPQSSWDVVLNLDTLAEAEGEDWVWQGASTLPPAHRYALVRLSRGGSDACVIREFDCERKAFIDDGFRLPEAKGMVAWLDADTLLMASAHGGDDRRTRSGYARTVRLWRRGTDPANAPSVFEIRPESVAAAVFVDRSAPTERVFFSDRVSFFEVEYWLGDSKGPQVKLGLPRDAWIGFWKSWFVLKTRSPWTVNGTTYQPDTLLAGDLPMLLRAKYDLTVLLEGGERIALQNFFWCGERLIVSVLDNLRPRYEALLPTASGWQRERLDGIPDIASSHAWRLDLEETESNGDLLVSSQDPLTPPTLSLFPASGAPTILKRAPAVFATDGLVVTRHEAISIDGERVPYVQTGPAGDNGDAPVLMSGYGGFGITREAVYNTGVGKLWLERGGTHVIANIRGGGEFGTRWHEAGRREGKRLTHDDFAAVAADLVRRGVTQPKRIAATGGSNGGILITNMMTRYPERFGALFCTIPLIDMRRYTRLLAGASWIDEYGDPDKPEDWSFLKTYSAYHAAEPAKDYPPILIATSRKDDRVHPGHARKMVAKLQAMGYAAYFYEPDAGGHSAGKDHKEQAAFLALGLGFLREKIGWA